MTMITPGTPPAPDSSWTTPARPPGPVVSPSPVTREIVAGGQAIASPGNPGTKADTVAASVAASVANAEARFHSHQQDTYAQGSALGSLVGLPPVVSDTSKHTGGADAG